MFKKILHLTDVTLCPLNQRQGATVRGKKVMLYTTKKYKEHKDLITLSCRKVSFEGKVDIIVVFKCYADIDAYIKPTLDGLTIAGVIKDDKLVKRLYTGVVKQKRGKPCTVILLAKDHNKKEVYNPSTMIDEIEESLK